MDAPPRGSGFGRRREKVCGEAGGRRAKLGEEQPAFGLLKGQSLEAGQCVFADSPTIPSKAQCPECLLGPEPAKRSPGLWRWPWWGGQQDSALGLLPGPRPLRVLVSLLEPDTLQGSGLASE